MPISKDTVKRALAAEILGMISRRTAQHIAEHPHDGWPIVAEVTGFREKAMALIGPTAPTFEACLEAVGLTRYDAIESFRRTKRAIIEAQAQDKKGKKPNAKSVLPIIPSALPTIAAPAPRNVVPAEPQRDPEPAPPRGDADRADKPAAVAAPVGKPGGNPGVRRPVRRAPQPEPVASPSNQASLF